MKTRTSIPFGRSRRILACVGIVTACAAVHALTQAEDVEAADWVQDLGPMHGCEGPGSTCLVLTLSDVECVDNKIYLTNARLQEVYNSPALQQYYCENEGDLLACSDCFS
jgi:hypothetical protein